MKDRIGIVAAVTQPFRGCGETGIIHLVKIVRIISTVTEPLLQIEPPYFIIILDGLRVILLLPEPVPGRGSGFTPGLIDDPGAGEFGFDLGFGGTVEHRGDRTIAKPLGRPAEMDFQNLADVHTTGYTQRVQNDVHRCAIFEEGHIFHRDNLRDHALVSMAAGHLVAGGQLATLGHGDADHHIHAGGEIGILFAGKDLDIDNLTALAMRHAQGGILYIAGLLTEDGAQQALFRGQFLFTLGCDLADQDVVRADLGADADNTVLVEVLDRVLADVRDVAGDLLGSQLGVTGFHFILFNMNGREAVLLDQALGDQDRIFEITAFPGEECHDYVLAKSQLSAFGGGRVGNNVALLDLLAFDDCRALVNAGALVGALVFAQLVGADSAALLNCDGVACHRCDLSVGLGNHHLTGVEGGVIFHAGRNKGNLRANQRDGLGLHVRAHQGAVGVVMLKEGDQRGADAHDLVRSHVHIIHCIGRGEDEA